jgi:hypothetical protein
MRRGVMEQMVSLISLGDGSTLTLDFTTGVLDSRLTFTRASDATFINSQGFVQYAAVNYFRNTGWTSGTTPTGWNVTFGTGTTTWNADGTLTMTAGGSAVRPCINATAFSVAQGIPFTFGFRVTAVSGSPTIDQVISSTVAGETFSRNGATVSGSTVVQNGDIISCTFTPTTTSNAARMGPGVNVGVTNISITITQPQFNPGTTLQPYYANTSTIAARWDSARFDHDPTTLAPRGLLVEGTATNICVNGSMAYTATSPTNWTRGFSGCTVASVDSTIFPGQKAWSISATASGQRDLLEQVIALAANTTYTVSVYLEAVTGTVATFAYMTSLPSGATSNTVVNPSAGRISFTVTVAATAGNGTLRIGIGSATGTGVSADASVRFSHVQVETGSGASSYIPTGASTATRNADICTMSNIAALNYNANGGTLFAHFSNNNENANFAGSIGFNNGANYAQRFRWSSGTLLGTYFQTNGTTTLGSNLSGSRTSFASAKAATSYSFDGTTTSTAMSINGAQASTTPTSSAVSGVSIATAFALNSDNSSAATAYPSIAIRSVKFYPTALTMAQMNAITANP